MKYALIAAGDGSRLLAEGVTQPKPLVEVHGESLLSRLFNIFINNDAESICIIINEKMVEVRTFLENVNLPIPLACSVRLHGGPDR